MKYNESYLGTNPSQAKCMSHLPWVEELNCVIHYTKAEGWKVSLLKLAFTKTLYGLWTHRNEVTFNHIVHKNIVADIKDNIVYKGSYTNKLKKHVTKLLL